MQGKDMILEVVLSTDGVEPLYFITPEDLTYQARCPLDGPKGRGVSVDNSVDFRPLQSSGGET